MGSRAFGEDEADVAFLDFLFGLDETSDGVAVTVNRDASAYSHYETAEFAVIGLKVGSCEAAHPLEVALGQIIDYKDAVRITLMVGSDDVWIVLREVLFAYAFHVAEDVSQEQEAVLGYNVPETAFRGVFLVQMLMVIRTGHLGLCVFGCTFFFIYCFFFFRHICS